MRVGGADADNRNFRDPAGAADQWFGKEVVHSGGTGVVSRCPTSCGPAVERPSCILLSGGSCPRHVVESHSRCKGWEGYRCRLATIPGEGIQLMKGKP